ncbi:MAG: hypothetical protein AB1705_07450 [Verrucomicrobiota bacterium]
MKTLENQLRAQQVPVSDLRELLKNASRHDESNFARQFVTREYTAEEAGELMPVLAAYKQRFGNNPTIGFLESRLRAALMNKRPDAAPK